jgi:hypothetical protein
MAEVFSPGPPAIIPRPIIRALQTMPAEATAEAAAIAGEAVTAVVEAINAAQPSGPEAAIRLTAAWLFRFILVCIGHQFGIT